ncbi:MAG TPA: PIG-L family deacetylase, partial [Acidimicrobiales bacterium]|nr:PIG-L family deacetylase [Acidimicrobiales bacterium]
MSTSPGAATTTIEEIALLGPALAVVAHPDDESFGLGAVLAALVRSGGDVRVLSFTHGEASTLGA